MNTAQIARWCNEIESIILEIYNTKRMMQFDECKKMLSKLKAIGAELSAKPVTNADRIRQMTDEELAKKLRCDSCLYQVMKSECELSDCVDGILAWLRKEVSEDATD